MSDTPRTDAEPWKKEDRPAWDALLEHARTLERESALWKARLDWLLHDYRGVDLYNAIGVLSADKSKPETMEKCYAAIDQQILLDDPDE